MNKSLVEIQSASADLRVQAGVLPAALTDPNRKLYRKAMGAIDAIEEGVRTGDHVMVNRGHNIIRSTVQTVKRQLCHGYHYPTPDPAFPERWEVVCTSGESGKFFKSQELCLGCLLFNTDFRPSKQEEKHAA